MSRKFIIETKPYDNTRIFYRKNIEIMPGITVLVGCNGAGKTTLIQSMKNQLKKEKIPYISFDNLHDGGANAKGEALFNEDFSLVANIMCSSEGENISLNLIQLGKKIVPFMKDGKIPRTRREKAFDFLLDKEEKEELEVPKER